METTAPNGGDKTADGRAVDADGRLLGADGHLLGNRTRSHRSAITNGTGVDGRTSTGRRFRDIIAEVTADLGGKELLSEAQRQIIRRGAALSIVCESVELDLVRDLPFDVGTYVTASNALRRIYETLGLERVARDATLTLSAYLEAKAAQPIEPEAAE